MTNKIKQVNKTKGAGIIRLSVFFLFTLFAATVFFAIEAAASGSTLSELEEKEALLVKANHEITELIVERSSLSKAQEKSEELGFVQANNIYYVPTAHTFAKLQ